MKDLVKAVLVIINSGQAGQTYNIGSDLQMSISELADDLRKRVSSLHMPVCAGKWCVCVYLYYEFQTVGHVMCLLKSHV